MKVVIEESSSLSSSYMTSFSDPFKQVLSTVENIREILSSDELPWEDLHHQYSFLPDLDKIEN